MNTENTTNENETTTPPAVVEDIIKRDIMRELPCKLTDDSLLKVAIKKAEAEAELEEMRDDFKDVKDDWGTRISDAEKRIAEMGAQLRTKEERRVIKCYERFVSGTIEVVRDDTKQVIDRRAASLAEAQRSLPSRTKAEDNEQAEAAAAAKAQRDNGVEEDDEGDVVPPAGDGKRGRKGKKS